MSAETVITMNRIRPGTPPCSSCGHPAGHWTTCHSPEAFAQDRADALAVAYDCERCLRVQARGIARACGKYGDECAGSLRERLARAASYRPLAIARGTYNEPV